MREANKKKGLSHGGACETMLIDNLSSMFQTDESSVIIFDTTISQENCSTSLDPDIIFC